MGPQFSLSSGARLNLSKDLQKFLQPAIRKARDLELSLYFVGGGVRDLLLKKPALDIDLVVEGPAEPLAKSLAKVYRAKLVSHSAFLTHTLQFTDGRHLDIATARMESYPEPAILPIVEPASLQEDLYRRDFSINSIAVSLNEPDFGHLWDAYSGIEDLEAGRIRALHADSFRDDPTRIFRAARFAGRFGYSLDWRTREWLLSSISKNRLSLLSGARLREELIPLLNEADPRASFSLLNEWGALPFIFSGLRWEKAHDVLFKQFLKAGKGQNLLLLKLLALTHALPVTKAVGGLSHMMFPQKLIAQIEATLNVFSALRDGSLSPKMMSQTVKNLGPEGRTFVEKALKSKALATKKSAADSWARLETSEPCLSGEDITRLGYKPGPIFGRILNALRQARWEGKLRTREEEVRFIKEMFPLHAR